MKRITALSALIITALPCAAHAGSTKIIAPYVEKDKTKLEWQNNYVFDGDKRDDGVWRQRAGISYGVTDYWKPIIRASYERGDNGNSDFTSVSFENTFQLTKKGEYFLDWGVKTEYEHTFDSDPDLVTAKLLVAKDTEDFFHLFNLKISHDVGSGSAHEFQGGLAYGIKYKMSDEFQPGLEAYNDFGSLNQEDIFRYQNRSVGPVIYGKFKGVSYQAGYLVGMTDATPNGVLKFSLEYQF